MSTRRRANRIVRPIFAAEAAGRVVEPVEGWGAHPSPGRPGWDEDDPLVREWFKIGELLQAEWAEQA
jgi:hypothetical protein